MNNPNSRDEMDQDLELALKLSLEFSKNDSRNFRENPGSSKKSNFSFVNYYENRKRPVELNDRNPAPKRLATSQESDYELALKLSEEINGQTPTPINNDEEDFALALQLANESNASTSVKINDEHDNEDFLLAIKLSEEDFQSEIGFEKSAIPAKSNNSQISRSSDQSSKRNYSDETLSVVDPSWETIDPVPDIYALFAAFNKRFFWGKLDCVEVKWSPRMTQCAGVCSYSPRAGFCSVRLSQALLKFRPRKDLVETMLHEMIHAFLFVTRNDRDRDGHGPRFLEHMNRINKESGAHITVYHSFHEEVKHYKTHWWKCNGPCQHRAPYYGTVKRSTNRAPGPNDFWWNDHRATCGGEFIKVKEPEGYASKTKKKKTPVNVIDNYFTPQAATSCHKSPVTSGSSYKPSTASGSAHKPPNRSSSDQFFHSSSSSYSSNIVGFSNSTNMMSTPNVTSTSNNLNRGQKILSLVDLNVKKNESSLSKSSNQTNNSKGPDKSKFVQLPGQKNIFRFINDW